MEERMDENIELTGVERRLFARAEQTQTPIYGGF